MSNKASLVAIAGLSAVCLGLLWNQHKNNEAMLAPAPTVEQKIEDGFDMGVVSVVSDENQKFVADQYVTNFYLYAENKNKDKAFKQLEVDRSKVLALFEKMGIDLKSVEQNTLNVYEDWDYVGKKRILNGYTARQGFQVYLPNKDRADSLELKLTDFSFVQRVVSKGRLKDADSLEVLTIKKACQKATQMAKEYAGSVGAQVGRVYSVKGDSYVNPYTSSDSVVLFANVSAELRLAGVKDGGKSFVEVSQSEVKKFAADKFRVSARIELMGPNKEPLYKGVAERMDSVLAMAKNLGVAQSELDVQGLSISRRTSREIQQDVNKLNVFVASQRVDVNFTSKKAAAAFMAGVSPMKDVIISDVNSVLRNEDSLRVQVVNSAGKKAMARAKALAEGFDGKLGRVISVGNDAYNVGVRPLLAKQMRANGVSRAMMAEDGLAGLLGGADEMNIADSVEISAFLKVVAEME